MKREISDIVRQGLDQRIKALNDAKAAAQRPSRGWLRAVRSAVGLSQEEVSRKLAVTRQAYADMEAAEERGTVGLKSLQRAAEAMDCELVYFVVPRGTAAPSFAALAQLHDPAFKHLQASEHSMLLEGQEVGDLRPKPDPSK